MSRPRAGRLQPASRRDRAATPPGLFRESHITLCHRSEAVNLRTGYQLVLANWNKASAGVRAMQDANLANSSRAKSWFARTRVCRHACDTQCSPAPPTRLREHGRRGMFHDCRYMYCNGCRDCYSRDALRSHVRVSGQSSRIRREPVDRVGAPALNCKLLRSRMPEGRVPPAQRSFIHECDQT